MVIYVPNFQMRPKALYIIECGHLRHILLFVFPTRIACTYPLRLSIPNTAPFPAAPRPRFPFRCPPQ